MRPRFPPALPPSGPGYSREHRWDGSFRPLRATSETAEHAPRSGLDAAERGQDLPRPGGLNLLELPLRASRAQLEVTLSLSRRLLLEALLPACPPQHALDRKSTRLNSSHANIS